MHGHMDVKFYIKRLCHDHQINTIMRPVTAHRTSSIYIHIWKWVYKDRGVHWRAAPACGRDSLDFVSGWSAWFSS